MIVNTAAVLLFLSKTVIVAVPAATPVMVTTWDATVAVAYAVLELETKYAPGIVKVASAAAAKGIVPLNAGIAATVTDAQYLFFDEALTTCWKYVGKIWTFCPSWPFSIQLKAKVPVASLQKALE